ncbi:MAG: CsgG/HfaB family protein [Candidatus Binatia bacterium]
MRASLQKFLSSGMCGVLAALLGTGLPYIPLSAAGVQLMEQEQVKKLIEEGITAYQQGHYQLAVSKLMEGRALLPSHSPTALYLGLAHLRQKENAQAIAAWQEYIKLRPYTEAEQKANLPQTLSGYLTLLLREENHRVAREAVALEQHLGPSDPQTIAITHYRNLGSPELAPLQKGLTALLISDVSQVKELQVVERDLLQALLEELQLGTTGLVDEKTAPKVGRLLGAGKVATGSYLDTAQGEVRADSLLAESTAAQVVSTQESYATLQEFHQLEKGLVLALLEDLGYDEARLRAAGVWDSIRQPQTTSMVALTAFSRGLDAKDQGNYAAARAQFDQALTADPNFAEARRERDALPVVILPSEGIATTVGSVAPSAAAATAGLGTTAAVAGGGVGAGSAATIAGAAALSTGGIGAIAAGAAALAGEFHTPPRKVASPFE